MICAHFPGRNYKLHMNYELYFFNLLRIHSKTVSHKFCTLFIPSYSNNVYGNDKKNICISLIFNNI